MKEPGIQIVFHVAPPGAGKGTLSEHLRYTLDPQVSLQVVSMSTILGNLVRTDGGLVPDDEVLRLFKREFGAHLAHTERLGDDDTPQKLIFVDGFPRTQAQACALMEMLHPHEMIATCVFEWCISDAVAIERQLARWRFHVKNPDRRRPDFVHSEIEAIAQAERRIDIFKQSARDILDIFSECCIQVAPIDGDETTEDVFKQFITVTKWPVDGRLYYGQFKSFWDPVLEFALP